MMVDKSYLAAFELSVFIQALCFTAYFYFVVGNVFTALIVFSFCIFLEMLYFPVA